jgi:hypothetical protein
MNAITRTALVAVVSAVCATACGQASGGTSSGVATSHTSVATSAEPTSSAPSTTEATVEPTGNAVTDTRAWFRRLPKSVRLAVSPGGVRLYPKSHGKVLLVALYIKGPIVLQRRWACRFLYPHFRQVLPIGGVEAVVFLATIGPAVYVGSTYAGDVRPCADTAVETTPQ